jgi:hypothetical protein
MSYHKFDFLLLLKLDQEKINHIQKWFQQYYYLMPIILFLVIILKMLFFIHRMDYHEFNHKSSLVHHLISKIFNEITKY